MKLFYTPSQMMTEWEAYRAMGGTMPLFEYVTYNPVVRVDREAFMAGRAA